MMKWLYWMVPVMTFGGASGAFFFKQGVQNVKSITGLFVQTKLYLGGALYVLSALMNIFLLRFLDYSVLYPMTAITYVWSALLAKFFLGERISLLKAIGIAAICIGVLFCV